MVVMDDIGEDSISTALLTANQFSPHCIFHSQGKSRAILEDARSWMGAHMETTTRQMSVISE
jgi:hypothetical protein